MRAAIWSWVRAKLPANRILPIWALAIRAILYPLDFLYWRMSQSRGYQWQTDTWLINGRRYSSQVFGKAGLLSPAGAALRIVDNAGEAIVVRTIFDLEQHLARQRSFSEHTFGPGMRTQGVVDHIRKELVEVLAKPADLSEWIDVAILALDGAWRTGATPEDIIAALLAKQEKNERRVWPDWRTAPADKAIEHDRSRDTLERHP